MIDADRKRGYIEDGEAWKIAYEELRNFDVDLYHRVIEDAAAKAHNRKLDTNAAGELEQLMVEAALAAVKIVGAP